MSKQADELQIASGGEVTLDSFVEAKRLELENISLERLTEIAQQIPDSDPAHPYWKAALEEFNAKRFGVAVKQFQRALNHVSQLENPRIWAALCTYQSLALWLEDFHVLRIRIEMVRARYGQAWETWWICSGRDFVAEHMHALALMYVAAGKMQEAAYYFEKALVVYSIANMPRDANRLTEWRDDHQNCLRFSRRAVR